jgi:hypothetical protein
MNKRDPDGPWWTISERDFLKALRRVADGEDPDLVYADIYVNSAHHRVDGSNE